LSALDNVLDRMVRTSCTLTFGLVTIDDLTRKYGYEQKKTHG
jgi:hypothetical protein